MCARVCMCAYVFVCVCMCVCVRVCVCFRFLPQYMWLLFQASSCNSLTLSRARYSIDLIPIKHHIITVAAVHKHKHSFMWRVQMRALARVDCFLLWVLMRPTFQYAAFVPGVQNVLSSVVSVKVRGHVTE